MLTMRKALFLVSFAALAGAIGLAAAQEGGQGPRANHFLQADANHDGVVTRQEFTTAHDAMFAQLDANHDGQLTREERRAHRGEHRRGGRHWGHHCDGAGPGGPGAADANNDGNITREEFLARPTQMFDRLDANHDGVISADERSAMRAQMAEHHRERGAGDRPNPDANGDHQISRAEFASMGAAMFDRMDANHDGRVTSDEMEAMHQRHGGGQ
jgi:EF hand